MLHPLDVITLRVEVDAWEVGTLATVLEVGADTVLAEVSDKSGRSLDILTVPVDAVERIDGGRVAGSKATWGRAAAANRRVDRPMLG